MANDKRKGIWIPIEILEDEQLDSTDKLLLSEIYSLCKLPEGCIASDNHFAKIVGIKRPAVNKRINDLKKLGYINTCNQFKEKLCVGRIITKSSSQKKHTIVPKEDRGSSQKIQGVVPTEDKGSSVGNTINTSTNTELLIQEKIHNTGGNAGGISIYQYEQQKKLSSNDTGINNKIDRLTEIRNEWKIKLKKLVQCNVNEIDNQVILNYHLEVKDLVEKIGWDKFYQLMVYSSKAELPEVIKSLQLEKEEASIIKIGTDFFDIMYQLDKTSTHRR